MLMSGSHRERRFAWARVRARAIPKALAGAIAAALFVLVPSRAHAYTWMIKHGYGGCPVCHADPSGGELLTAYGRVQSDLLLRMHYTKNAMSAEGSKSDSGSFDSFDSFDDDSESKDQSSTAPKSAPKIEERAAPESGEKSEPAEPHIEDSEDAPKGKEAGAAGQYAKKKKRKKKVKGTEANPIDMDAEAAAETTKPKKGKRHGKKKEAEEEEAAPAEGQEGEPKEAEGSEAAAAEAGASDEPAKAGADAETTASASGALAAGAGSSSSGGDAAHSQALESPDYGEKAAGSSSGESPIAADEGIPPGSGFLWGLIKPPDWLLLGGSYRHMILDRPGLSGSFRTFPMMADFYGQMNFGGFMMGGSVGYSQVAAGSPYARAAQVTHNQGGGPNLLSRTHYVGYTFANGAYVLRAGRLNLPFGIRIPEHTMWVRQMTHTDRESAQEHGVAFAFNGSSFRGEVMGIAGNYQVNPDDFRNRGYSLYIEYLASATTAVGVSSLVTHAKVDRYTTKRDITRMAHGAFTRLGLTDQLVLLLEANALKRSGAELGYVGFAQADFEVVQGLHFMATGETLDQGFENTGGTSRSVGAGKPAFGGWGSIDWFFLPHCEFRADVLKRTNDKLWVFGQLHVFL